MVLSIPNIYTYAPAWIVHVGLKGYQYKSAWNINKLSLHNIVLWFFGYQNSYNSTTGYLQYNKGFLDLLSNIRWFRYSSTNNSWRSLFPISTRCMCLESISGKLTLIRISNCAYKQTSVFVLMQHLIKKNTHFLNLFLRIDHPLKGRKSGAVLTYDITLYIVHFVFT